MGDTTSLRVSRENHRRLQRHMAYQDTQDSFVGKLLDCYEKQQKAQS